MRYPVLVAIVALMTLTSFAHAQTTESAPNTGEPAYQPEAVPNPAAAPNPNAPVCPPATAPITSGPIYQPVTAPPTPTVPVCPPVAANACGPTFRTEHEKLWRAALIFTWLTNGSSRDKMGDGWGIEVERSFGELWGGNITGLFAYRRFSNTDEGFDNSMNYFTFGTKLRWGKGANPTNDGLYYGAGLGISIIDEELYNNSDTGVGFEGMVLGGYNFAKSWYGEVSYRTPVDVNGIGTNNLTFDLGYRF